CRPTAAPDGPGEFPVRVGRSSADLPFTCGSHRRDPNGRGAGPAASQWLARMHGAEGKAVTGVIDTVAWVHLEDGRILCARPRGKDVFYVPGGKREGMESDLQALEREAAEELTVALRPGTVARAGSYQADDPH